eukprot:gnl/MRDRNA2_/MRDRNA2_105697_c0_seq1.p1 gnl/MRDRNA2_/MRDRNA2_105697_c0~~gnl/MRDRNA2_/MRDRNA2_105697_c0_seq1.p1  ORF type:complete len:616 (-),score=137.76 gnl/MRDRNA2_/MRDRNA2_105697_c0_seq1:56-1903(-)
MRLGDDAEIAKLLKELRVDIRNKPSETPHVRHLIQLSTELRGPRSNEGMESCHLEEVSRPYGSTEASMSVDKWKVLGVPEQRMYLQGVQDTLCAVLGVRCSYAWSIEDILNFGSTVSVAAVRVLSHALLLAATGATRGDVSAKCGSTDTQEEKRSSIVKKSPGKGQIAALLDSKKVRIQGPASPTSPKLMVPEPVKGEPSLSAREEETLDPSPRVALRPDSSGNLVQVEATTIGLYATPESKPILLTSENAIPPSSGHPSEQSSKRPRGIRVQQTGRLGLNKKAANEELQDLWNFGREHHGNKKHLTDSEAEQVKLGLKREARRFVRDEVDCKSRDELFELRMRHNAQFRARSQAELEAAAAAAAPTTPSSKKDTRGINTPVSSSKSQGALGLAGAAVLARPHAQELRELMYQLRPELKPKQKKAEAAEFLAADFKGMFGGPAVAKGGSGMGGSRDASKRKSVQNATPVNQPIIEELFSFIERKSMQYLDLAQYLDQNGNGSISMSEFLSGLKAMNYIDEETAHHSVDSCKRLFWTMDKDKSGLISMKELKAFFEDLSPKRRQVIHEELKVPGNPGPSDDDQHNRIDADIAVAMNNKMKALRRNQSLTDVAQGSM